MRPIDARLTAFAPGRTQRGFSKITLRRLLCACVAVLWCVAFDVGQTAPAPGSPAADARFTEVPGTVIDHSPAASGVYIGSPALAVLPNGEYIASHDFFGPGSEKNRTDLFSSQDKGRTWRRIATVIGQCWSSLFFHRNALYLMGTSRENGFAVIRKSTDGGRTWTEPKDETSGLLFGDGRYHCAPVPVVLHRGRLWRAMEDAMGPDGWGRHFNSFMMSADENADLLRAANWRSSNRLAGNPNWLDGGFGGWLEGNAVVAPEGTVVNMLRVDTPSCPEKVAMVRTSRDGREAGFDPATGFIDFPGGAKKFTIRFDPESRQYWCVASIVAEPYKSKGKPAGIRNTLALTCSPDLQRWVVRRVLLEHPDTLKHGFQYVDWLFDGRDIIAVCRTAYDDGLGGAHNYHDANFLTFHRFEDFR